MAPWGNKRVGRLIVVGLYNILLFILQVLSNFTLNFEMIFNEKMLNICWNKRDTNIITIRSALRILHVIDVSHLLKNLVEAQKGKEKFVL